MQDSGEIHFRKDSQHEYIFSVTIKHIKQLLGISTHTSTDFYRTPKSYCLAVMIYRQIYDVLILNGNPIRVPEIISVFINLFYSGNIRSFLIVKVAM